MNVYTRHQVPLPKISADCPEVEHTGILRMFIYDHGDCRLWKIAIVEFPTPLGITGTMELLLSSTTLFPSFMVRLEGYCSKISFYTRMCTVMQFNTRVLCLLPPLVALFLHGILVVAVRFSSTIIIIVSSTRIRVS